MINSYASYTLLGFSEKKPTRQLDNACYLRCHFYHYRGYKRGSSLDAAAAMVLRRRKTNDLNISMNQYHMMIQEINKMLEKVVATRPPVLVHRSHKHIILVERICVVMNAIERRLRRIHSYFLLLKVSSLRRRSIVCH